MLAQKQNRLKKPLVISVVMIMLLVLGFIIYNLLFIPKDPTSSYSPQYPDSTSIENTPSGNNTHDTTKVANPQGEQIAEDVPVASGGSVNILDFNQQNGFVNALAKVNAFTPIKCVYLFESEGTRPVVRELSGDCTGISIPQVEFEKIGKYVLTVTAYSDSEKLSTSKELSIR